MNTIRTAARGAIVANLADGMGDCRTEVAVGHTMNVSDQSAACDLAICEYVSDRPSENSGLRADPSRHRAAERRAGVGEFQAATGRRATRRSVRDVPNTWKS